MLKLTGFWVFSAVNFVIQQELQQLQESALWGVVHMGRSLKVGGSGMLLHQLSGHLTLHVSLSHPVSCPGDHNRFDLFPWTRQMHFNILGGRELEFLSKCKMVTITLLHFSSRAYLKILQSVTEKLCRLKWKQTIGRLQLLTCPIVLGKVCPTIPHTALCTPS